MPCEWEGPAALDTKGVVTLLLVRGVVRPFGRRDGWGFPPPVLLSLILLTRLSGHSALKHEQPAEGLVAFYFPSCPFPRESSLRFPEV